MPFVCFLIVKQSYSRGSYGQGEWRKVGENLEGQGKLGNLKVPRCRS